MTTSDTNRFCHYELRTTDVDAARTFYAALFGPGFWEGSIGIAELPAQAAARGAPPHWLGSIGVDDVAATVRRFVEVGATPLGPPAGSGDDARAILRDPFGAIVALRSSRAAKVSERVAWHLLATRDESAAFTAYADLLGWTSLGMHEHPGDGSRHVAFTWGGSAPAVGSITNLAALPGVHAQWLFFFPTDDLERSLARVRDHGGRTLPTTVTAEGHVVAPCEDPQGAAFALCQAGDRW